MYSFKPFFFNLRQKQWAHSSNEYMFVNHYLSLIKEMAMSHGIRSSCQWSCKYWECQADNSKSSCFPSSVLRMALMCRWMCADWCISVCQQWGFRTVHRSGWDRSSRRNRCCWIWMECERHQVLTPHSLSKRMILLSIITLTWKI